MPPSSQLVLPFPYQPGYAAVDFLRAPSNEDAVAWLARTQDWPCGQLALWGQAGCGKTHLLHIWAARAGAALRSAAQPGGMPDLPTSGGLAIDDAEQAAEEPLLHLLNAAREAKLPVLLAARQPPARWPTRLPDLTSRLRAITAVEIGPPEDSLLQGLLMRLLADRQLVLSPVLQDWLRRRLPRAPGVLREVVERLDRAALAGGGKIARPLAAAVLADLLPDVEKSAADPSRPSPRPPPLL